MPLVCQKLSTTGLAHARIAALSQCRTCAACDRAVSHCGSSAGQDEASVGIAQHGRDDGVMLTRRRQPVRICSVRQLPERRTAETPIQPRPCPPPAARPTTGSEACIAATASNCRYLALLRTLAAAAMSTEPCWHRMALVWTRRVAGAAGLNGRVHDRWASKLMTTTELHALP